MGNWILKKVVQGRFFQFSAVRLVTVNEFSGKIQVGGQGAQGYSILPSLSCSPLMS